MRYHKRTTLATVAALALSALCGCSSPHEVSPEEFSTKDAVFAVQLGSQAGNSGGLLPLPDAGYVMVVRKDGSAQTLNVGLMDDARPLWTEKGLFFGGTHDEYHVTESGLTQIPRNMDEDHEISRFATPEPSMDFIAVYNHGFTDKGYSQHIVLVQSDNSQLFDNNGIYVTVGLCGEGVYSQTSTDYAYDAAVDAQQLYVQRGAPTTPGSETTLGSGLDIFVRINSSDPTTDKPTVIGVATRDDAISYGGRSFPCIDDTAFIPTFRRNSTTPDRSLPPDQQPGQEIFQAWNLSSGERQYVPLVTEDGSPVPLTEGDAFFPAASQDDHLWRFVTDTGAVYETELPSGVTKLLFTVPDADASIVGHTRFAMTQHNLFVLREATTADDTPEISTLERYRLSDGTHETVLRFQGLEDYLGDSIHTFGMAINPHWEASLDK